MRGFLFWNLLWGIFSVQLLALENADCTESSFFSFEAAAANEPLPPPPPVFSYNEHSTFAPQIPKVNVITGEYCEEELDYILAGAEPLSLIRFYNHLSSDNKSAGTWLFNPESYAVANFEYGGLKLFVSVGEKDGTLYTYENKEGQSYRFNPLSPEYLGRGSGQNHPLNTQIIYTHLNSRIGFLPAPASPFLSPSASPISPPDMGCFAGLKSGAPGLAKFPILESRCVYHKKPGQLVEGIKEPQFSWGGEIRDGGGTVRSFSTPNYWWLKELRESKHKKHPPTEWTPYNLQITEEKKANGNRIVYTPDTISAYNSASELIGQIKLERKDNTLTVLGSDGRKATLTYVNDRIVRPDLGEISL